MSKFDQLTASYDAKGRYWDGLQSMVSRVRKEFCAHLGVPDAKSINIGGYTIPVVSTGKVDELGNFAIYPDDELPTDNESIFFSMRLAYGVTDSAPRIDVKPFVVFNLAIRETANGYPVTIMRDAEKKEFNGPLYTLLFEELFVSAMDSLK